jgi:hypothetical protein
MFKDFVFVDGWRLFSSKGNYLYVTADDLENYKLNGLSEDEIKTISFSYLTSQDLFNLSVTDEIYHEF